MTSQTSLLTAVVIILVGAALIRRLPSFRRRAPLAPGPPGDPIIGHVRHIPTLHSWLYYTDLHKKYGNLIRISALGTPIVVLGSVKVASDLLGKRADIYSDRPSFPSANELLGLGQTPVLAAYGPQWKEQRRLFHSYLRKGVIRKYWERLEREANAYVVRVVDGVTTPLDGLRLATTKSILGVAYGFEVNSVDEPEVKATIRGTEVIASTAQPGNWLCDLFPALLLVPGWFPGMQWRKDARVYKGEIRQMFTRPWDRVVREEAAGIAPESFARDMMRGESNKLDAETQMQTAATMYIAGADTTLGVAKKFVLAMVMFPEVQKRAQKEIDHVVGRERLPNLADQGSLPYVEALFKEVLRWKANSPIGIPHRVKEEDVYEGYRVEKDSIVIANLWAMSNDKETYPEPDLFNPDRFLAQDSKSELPMDPRSFVFGVGRRICPGMHFAELSVISIMLTLLATVDIVKEVDAEGNDIPVTSETTGGLSNSPCDFRCKFVPRSSEAISMARTVAT